MKAIDYAAPNTVAEAVAPARRARATRPASWPAAPTSSCSSARIAAIIDLLVDVKHIPEVNELSFDAAQGLQLGAAVPCYRIYEHAEIAKAYPGLIDAASLVGGIQIQSRASVGGNLCNSSPAADTIPALIALEAVCRHRRAERASARCRSSSSAPAPGRTC